MAVPPLQEGPCSSLSGLQLDHKPAIRLSASHIQGLPTRAALFLSLVTLKGAIAKKQMLHASVHKGVLLVHLYVHLQVHIEVCIVNTPCTQTGVHG